ncbi:DUF6193 family natural product biosynthesis protein [Streptomyces sp. NPDC023327]|uniref:DUF6193 family natural product biosynthesis protein n=1 Tax=Streptomyces sp. NPDC023327 TaxID=3157088 RepID=UPI0033EA023E
MKEELYPDLAELGGLQQALAHAAGQRGKDLGLIEGATSPSLEDPNSAKLLSGRGTIMIYLGADERRFIISTANVRHSWMEGVTDDFGDVMDVVLAWQGGTTLQDLGSRYPFMEYNELAQANEDGDPVATQWDVLLRDDAFADYLPLTREIHAQERLRSLFPFYSMGMLRLSRDHTSRQAGEIRISPLRGGGYRVESTTSGEQIHVAALDQLADAALSLL